MCYSTLLFSITSADPRVLTRETTARHQLYAPVWELQCWRFELVKANSYAHICVQLNDVAERVDAKDQGLSDFDSAITIQYLSDLLGGHQ